MAIDGTGGDEESGQSVVGTAPADVTVGEYSWSDFRREEHDGGQFDQQEYLGFAPRDLPRLLEAGASAGKTLGQHWDAFRDPEDRGVRRGEYTWEHFKQEYYYDEEGEPPRDKNGEKIPFDAEEYLGFEREESQAVVDEAKSIGESLGALVDERTVDVNPDLDEDAFFSTVDGTTTVVNRYDLEKAVPMRKKTHFVEEDRYWVNKPYACVVIFHSRKENEKKYYVIEPHLNEIEEELREFLSGKLKTAIKYSEDDVIVQGSEADRANVIQREAEDLLNRYDLFEGSVRKQNGGGGMVGSIKSKLGMGSPSADGEDQLPTSRVEGIEVRPEPIVLEANA
jgi:flagellar protein FlaI